MTQNNDKAKQNAATALLSKIGAAPEPKPNAIPCGYKEQISEGKTLMCGNTYRGETFYCRDCMKAMLSNAHDIANNIAEMMLVAVTDHDIEGKVSDSTIQVMRDFLVNIGAVSPE